jgi:hypothetical protein
MISLFDGREEGVHIDVEDDAIGGQVRVGQRVVAGAREAKIRTSLV